MIDWKDSFLKWPAVMYLMGPDVELYSFIYPCSMTYCLAKGKGNVDLYSAYTRNISNVLRCSMHCQWITQFCLHTLHFIHK